MKYVVATLTPTIEFVCYWCNNDFMVRWYSVINGDITAGALVAFLTYAEIFNPIKRLVVITHIQRALKLRIVYSMY